MEIEKHQELLNKLRKTNNEDERYTITSGRIYKKVKNNGTREVVIRHELLRILKRSHDDPLGGHFGIKKIYEKLKMRYYWKGMIEDIKKYVGSCDICQRYKAGEKGEELHPIKVNKIFERVGIDIVGPLPETGRKNKYIIVAVEYLTKC